MTGPIRRVRIRRVVIRDGSVSHHDAARLSQLVTEAMTRREAGTGIPQPGVRGVASQIADEVTGAVPPAGGVA